MHRLRTVADVLVARGRAPRGARSDDRGSVLVETAVAIPLLLVITAALLWALTLGTATLALQEAARQVARDIARGGDVTAAVSAAEAALPGVQMAVDDDGRRITVQASRRVAAPVPLLSGIEVPLSQQVSVPREWS